MPPLPRTEIHAARRREPVAFWLASWFGCGLSPVAPGTVGSIGALPLYFLVASHGPAAILATATVLTIVGVWASKKMAEATGRKDPQFVVIDEAAGVMIALAIAPPTWQGVLAGLVLFRFFDITKPPPCRWCERNLTPGLGIMFDDVFAGLWAGSVLLVLRMMGWF